MSVAQQKNKDLQNKILASQINGKINEAYLKGQRDGIYDTINLLLWTLHTKDGYGEKRLAKVYKEVVYLSDCVIAKTLSLEDIRQALADECNIMVGSVK